MLVQYFDRALLYVRILRMGCAVLYAGVFTQCSILFCCTASLPAPPSLTFSIADSGRMWKDWQFFSVESGFLAVAMPPTFCWEKKNTNNTTKTKAKTFFFRASRPMPCCNQWVSVKNRENVMAIQRGWSNAPEYNDFFFSGAGTPAGITRECCIDGASGIPRRCCQMPAPDNRGYSHTSQRKS